MAEISETLEQLYGDKFKKIPCLNEGNCKLHQELLENQEVIVNMLTANHVELDDLRQGFAIMLEEHGIPCDDITGWDLNTYRENKKNVRKSGIQRSKNENTNVDERKGLGIQGKKQKKKRRREKNVRSNRNRNPKT